MLIIQIIKLIIAAILKPDVVFAFLYRLYNYYLPLLALINYKTGIGSGGAGLWGSNTATPTLESAQP